MLKNTRFCPMFTKTSLKTGQLTQFEETGERRPATSFRWQDVRQRFSDVFTMKEQDPFADCLLRPC